jgi:TM2 domain-containing membrane protein YozV
MKSKGTAIALAFFLGGLGIHKFYLDKPGLGILYVCFCWTFIPGIIAFIEVIIMLCMSSEEFNAKYNTTSTNFQM